MENLTEHAQSHLGYVWICSLMKSLLNKSLLYDKLILQSKSFMGLNFSINCFYKIYYKLIFKLKITCEYNISYFYKLF